MYTISGVRKINIYIEDLEFDLATTSVRSLSFSGSSMFFRPFTFFAEVIVL